MREGATYEGEWAVSWGRWAASSIVAGRRKSSPYWVGALTPQPLPSVTSSLRAPGAQQPGLAQRGQAGVVGGSFQLQLCLGKIPFHVAACDLSRRLYRRGGRPAGNRGRCCSQGHPHPLHKASCSTSRSLSGQGGSSSGAAGWAAWPAGGTQAGGPRLPPPCCWQYTGRRWPRPALIGMPTGVGWTAPVPARRGLL